MQDLKVIGVESGSLLVASDAGERFRVAMDESLRSALRSATTAGPAGPRIPPKEIQSHIRAGMSADDVARVTGAPLEYVRRFEGPVLAEREHMVGAALSVPVHTPIDPDPVDDHTFGTVIRERLASLGALRERWASWKEPEGGWIVKLAFVVDDIDHDARWAFEPKKNNLTPVNPEAITLSRQGELPTALIPRLRAVGTEDKPDTSRFDSGAFAPAEQTPAEKGPVEPLPYGRAGGSVNPSPVTAIRAAEPPAREDTKTADLLEALRKRRGERESAATRGLDDDAAGLTLGREDHSVSPAPAPAPAPARLPQSRPIGAHPAGTAQGAGPAQRAAPLAGRPQDSPADHQSASSDRSSPSLRGGGPSTPAPTGPVTGTTARGRKGRAAMPSWDEIVFGSRGDDEPAS